MKKGHSMCKVDHTTGQQKCDFCFAFLSKPMKNVSGCCCCFVLLYKCADHNILDKYMNHIWLNCWKANGRWQQIHEHFANKMLSDLSYFLCKLFFLGSMILFNFKLNYYDTMEFCSWQGPLKILFLTIRSPIAEKVSIKFTTKKNIVC